MYEVRWSTGRPPTPSPTGRPSNTTSRRSGRRPTRSCTPKTLETVASARTRLERDFDPEAVRQLKASAGRDLTVGGPDLAAQAFKAGLVDECHLFLAPMVVGGGNQALPDHLRLRLELLDERRFGNGMV
jgi:riboflavin biosynthesis pyrimidine reductase